MLGWLAYLNIGNCLLSSWTESELDLANILSRTVNPNQWGYTEGDPGAMCMNVCHSLPAILPQIHHSSTSHLSKAPSNLPQVTSFNNGTYSTPSTAPEFSVTWAYSPGPASQPVHAFPNVQVLTDMPYLLSTIKTIALSTHWTYGVGDTPAATTSESELLANAVNTNVAIDMFLDADKTAAENSSLANYEVMIWFAKFGTAAQAIGQEDGVVTTESINGTTLYVFPLPCPV